VAPSRKGRRVPLSSWVALAVSASSAGVGVGFGVATLNANGQYASTGAASAADDFRRDRIITNVAWGTAIVAAATALALWLATPGEVTAGAATSSARPSLTTIAKF
jgi:hypothetical protein